MTAQGVSLVLVEEIAKAYLADEEPNLDVLETLWSLYRMLRRGEGTRATFEQLAADLPRQVQREMVRKLSGIEEPGAVLLVEILGQRTLTVVKAVHIPGEGTK